MIKEFAIEPRVMATLEHFNALWKDFGVGNGRLISRFPRSWNREVYDLAQKLNPNQPPVRVAALCEKIRQGALRFIPSRREFNPQASWLANAAGQMKSKPFHAIVAKENPEGHASVLVAEEVDPEHPLYRVDPDRKVPRTAETLAQCAALVLAVCEEIQLVDPHFDVFKERFRETFAEILAARRTAPQRLRVCEIHTKKPALFEQRTQKALFERHFQKALPADTVLRVHFWSEKPGGEKLHPRFLLTEWGGLQFDYGLDEGEGLGDTTWVMLMKQGMWETVRADYRCPSRAFTITDDCIVEIPACS
jgi:hypothetical protein